MLIQKGNRTYLNQEEIDDMEDTMVKAVPPTPNGPAKYEVLYNEKDPLSAVADDWNWGRAQPCKRKDFCEGGRRTLQICQGSMECPNLSCPFKKIHKATNKVDFTKKKTCLHCKAVASEIKCSARKYVENDRCHTKMKVIYIGEHSCQPRVRERKPDKSKGEKVVRVRPTITPGQLQMETVREALLSGKSGEEVADVAMQYSNRRHLQYIQTKMQETTRPGGSDIEAVRVLKEDFAKRGLDNNLILEVGHDFVILSSEEKIRLGAHITLGMVHEPVSLDGCESHAKNYSEVEMTTYYPLIRRNVKLVSMFAPKPGENSDNVAKMVSSFDEAVNKILPRVAEEHGHNPEDFRGRGLDAHAYVGDEGGALWSGLCKAKGNDVKDRTVSDTYHVKQDIHRHQKYFRDASDKTSFSKIMSDAMNAPTSIQADVAEKALDKLIATKATDKKKMTNFKNWWWRRRLRWQRWCKTDASSSASSAEVANSKSISASGYRKRLLDVVTTECSSAVLEAAEIKRQQIGLKTVGRGPSIADREEQQEQNLFQDQQASADAVQFVAANAESLLAQSNPMQSFGTAKGDFRVNTRDSHRSDKRKKNSNTQKPPTQGNNLATKKQLKYFEKSVEGVSMDILEYKSDMTSFEFCMLDTMGYLQNVTISKENTTCSSPAGCKKNCHHLVWLLYKIFNFEQSCPLIYKRKFSNAEWEKVIEAFPHRVPVTDVSKCSTDNQVFHIDIKKTRKEAKCATCKNIISFGALQASTEGPYRTIHLTWIKRTFFFCPRKECISKLPRNCYIKPFQAGVAVTYDPELTSEQKALININN